MEINNQKNDQNIIPNDADKQQKGVNVPNLRFPNFNSAWQKNKFGNLLTLLKNNTLSRAELNYENGKIKNIHYGDILIKFNYFVLSDSKIIPYINDDRIPHNYADLLLKTGDLIIADTAEDYTVGKATELIFNDQSLIISGLHTIPCRPINTIFGSKYLGYYINSPSFHNQLLPLIQGIKVSSISKSQIVDTFISYPKIDEQCKITEFLTLIDQRINTQSKIIEDLELFKNMISYKVLYDDKTACYKPLSSFSELKNRYAFKSNTYSSKGDYQIVTIANVSGNRYIDLTSSNKILNIPNDIQSHQILKINDILISLTGNVGRVSYCNKLNCLLNQRVGLLSIKNKDLIEYIFQCIHNKIFEKTMISRGQGVAQLNIGKYDVESFEIPVYSQDRMNTISEVLKLIDLKIIKEKDILELYKKQKAYLLKNMFI